MSSAKASTSVSMASAPTIIEFLEVPPADHWAGAKAPALFFCPVHGEVATSGATRHLFMNGKDQVSSALTNSAQRSPIIMLGALVLPLISLGMIDASEM